MKCYFSTAAQVMPLAVLLALSLLATDGVSQSQDADTYKEPPVTYSLKVGDKSINIREGEPARLEGTFTNPEITLTAVPHRVFPYEGISFNYPRAFTFEADISDANAKLWTLSGNDFKVMYFVLNTQVTTAEYADGMVDIFGKQNCTLPEENANITLGNHALAGTSFQVTLAGHSMIMDIYLIPSDGTGTRLLVLQDNLNESGNRSPEGIETIKLLESSFQMEQ